MIDTPAGPIPTLADLSIFAGLAAVNASNNNRAGKRKARIYTAWLAEIGPNCPGCGSLMHSYDSPALRLSAPEQITIDHVVARALGGDHSTSNQWCICRACNVAKSTIEAVQAWRRRAAA